MKKIKVAQFGLGPIGISCLQLLAQKEWVEIVGGVDIDPGKIGKTLTEVSGIPGLENQKVYASVGELCASDTPDAVLHTAGSRANISIEQAKPMVEKGIAVVSSCEELLYPYLRAKKEAKEMDAFCKEHGGWILGTGVNPGFVLDVLPSCITGVCSEVNGIYGERVVNASTRRGPLQKKVGSGLSPKAFKALWDQGKAGHAGFQESLMLIAHSLNWEITKLEETLEPMIAEEDIKTEYFEVKKGETCGLHQVVKGTASNGKYIHLDLKMYLEAKDPHDYVRIDGEPALEVNVPNGVAGDTATVAALVNAIPRVLKSSPGVKLMTDIPVPSFA